MSIALKIISNFLTLEHIFSLNFFSDLNDILEENKIPLKILDKKKA
jgi:hypothetical protein